MIDNQENSKRIAKNTIVLYIRTLLTILIGLFTSRLILKVLGINDFGIYNVVGGIVTLFTIITASLTQSVSRFITVELGANNKKRLQDVFSTSINIMILISMIVLLLSETIGVWFLNNKMNIESNRMYAANWVFQFSSISFIVTLISIPYNAVIIAHEKMKAFAYVGILESILKLITVLILYITPIDKLITYSFMLLIVSIIIRLIYSSYCKKNFEECKYRFFIEKKLLTEMFGFAGWNVIASATYVVNTQGINIISNLFFGVSINAARGITTQVESIIMNFVSNFTTAVKPQIVKSYSSKKFDYMSHLLCSGTKYSYFLMLLFSLPIIFEIETILKLWLNVYPEYTTIFIRLAMILSLVGIMSDLLFTNILAIGKLKKYMIWESCISCLIFIVSYLSFLKGSSPITPYIMFVCVYLILIAVRLYYLKITEEFSLNQYIKETLFPIIKVTLISIIIPITLKLSLTPSLSSSIIIIITTSCSVCCGIYVLGVKRTEREFINQKLKTLIKKTKAYHIINTYF